MPVCSRTKRCFTKDRAWMRGTDSTVGRKLGRNLGAKLTPLRCEIRKSWRVRPTDSTGLMAGAVGIETASLTSKSRQRKALRTAPYPKC